MEPLVRPAAVALFVLGACASPGPGPESPGDPDAARLVVSLREGSLSGEIRASMPLREVVLDPPVRLVGVLGTDGPVPFAPSSSHDRPGQRFELGPARGPVRLRFAAFDIADPASHYLHVSEERVELAGWRWYPDPGTSVVLEVEADLPVTMHILCSGRELERGRSWELAAGQRFAVVGIANAEEASARGERGSVSLFSEPLYLPRSDARALAEQAVEALDTYSEAFGPVERERFTIAMPPRLGGGYWTDGLLVVGQYYAGYEDPGEASDEAATLRPDVSSLVFDADDLPDPATAASSARPASWGLAELVSWRRHAVVHEVAHQWWHDLPVVRGWLSLDEGLSEYSVLLVVDALGRERALMQHVSTLIAAVFRPELYAGAARDPDAYDRSPMFFLRLERELGRERVFAFLRRLHEAHQVEALTEAEFERLLVDSLGAVALQTLEEWSTRGGSPRAPRPPSDRAPGSPSSSASRASRAHVSARSGSGSAARRSRRRSANGR